MIKTLGLLGIHFFAALAIWLSTYIVGLDIFLSLVYLLIISVEVKSLQKEPLKVKWWAAALWLSIPLILSFMTFFNLSGMTIFLLEFWYTPVLPLLSLKPYLFDSGRPLYYYILIILPLIFSLHFYGLTKKHKW